MYCPKLECRRTKILLYIPEKKKNSVYQILDNAAT